MCSRSALRPAHMPAMPSCTVDGAFGIARTTGTLGPRCFSIVAVVIAAATEITVCSAVSRCPTSPSRISMSCGLTASTTTSAPLIASMLEIVVSTPSRSVSSSARSSRRHEAMRLAQSELRSPASSASPILPAPRIAMRIAQAYEPGAICRQEIHACEAGPLPVRREQHVGLLGLDAASPQRGRELDEAEVARQAALVAAEPLEADHADRPRPEAALAEQPARDRVRRMAFE